MITHFSESAAQTEQIAAQFARLLCPGDVIACRGGMGAGKTAFARGLARGLNLSDDVSSPTFALVHEYANGPVALFHFDMYRITDEDSLYYTGFYDYLDRGGILLIEWSENIPYALPDNTITLTIEPISENSRKITIEGDRF